MDDHTVQLRQMAVVESHRGQKIGHAILKFAEKTVKKKDYWMLMKHTFDPVMEFYKKSGYEIAGEQFFEVGMGHHRMEKKLWWESSIDNRETFKSYDVRFNRQVRSFGPGG